ncbi:MAG: amidase, partial [Alphaproteobacteria bacterium]|nr:amidase [Alphaproteobacteria bacterium]
SRRVVGERCRCPVDDRARPDVAPAARLDHRSPRCGGVRRGEAYPADPVALVEGHGPTLFAACDDVDRQPPSAPSLALLRTHRWHEASPDTQAALERAARAAEAAGARVRELELPPIFEAAWQAQIVIQDHEAYRALAYEFDQHRNRLGPILREQLAAAAAIDSDRYDEARRTARRARQAFANLMSDTDAVLTPSANGAAPPGLGSTGDPAFNRLWTLLGAPCVNVPGLTDCGGLPLGVQIVGRFGRDRNALEAALFTEQTLRALS